MKKIVSLLIVITMMLCMFPASSMTASATTTEFNGLVDLSNKADGDTYYDEENKITYTVVRSAEKLIECVKANLAGNYILAENIETTSTYKSPMFGNTNDTFTGVLDGNGFSIYGFTTTYPSGWSYQGGCVGVLFNNIGGNATIKNLSVGRAGKNVQVTVSATEAGLVGVIAGKVASSTTEQNTVTISNVNVYADISYAATKSAELCVGGIIGKTDRPANSNTAYTINISDTTFHGSICFTESAAVSGFNTSVGGMIGYVYGGGTIDIQRSSNYANIDATNRTSGTKNTYVGGFVGNTIRQITFTDCVNFGNVTSDKYSAGFLGTVDLGNYSTLRSTLYTFRNCTNHGNISSVTGDASVKAYAGGIMGYANFGTYSFNNCGNTGDISSSYSIGAGASGILGRYYLGDQDSSFTNCYTTGTITSAYSIIYAICAGAGASGAAITVKNCVWANDKYSGTLGTLTDESGNNEAKNILAKETANDFEAYIQKSNDNTKIRVVLLTKATELDSNTNVVVKVWCGNSGKQFTIPASKIFAFESVDAAGETYYGVGGTYIFGAVVTGIPEDVMNTVTDVTVEYGDYSANFIMKK